MKNNYLSPNKDDCSNEYLKKSTYLMKNDQESIKVPYCSLPEELDVFSNIDNSLFSRSDTAQYVLISLCLNYMKELLYNSYILNRVIVALPKLNIITDNEGTISFLWAYSTFRATLSFEDARGNFDAYCTIVFQTDTDSVSTYTKKISIENHENSIKELLDIVLANT